MLTAGQMRQFKTFGFVVMRNVLTTDELKKIRSEFDHRSAVASSYDPFDGSKAHTFDMMGMTLPFAPRFWKTQGLPQQPSRSLETF